ncbi:MAG: hypothetical protein ACR2KW_11830 [Rubrobacter sp.]
MSEQTSQRGQGRLAGALARKSRSAPQRVEEPAEEPAEELPEGRTSRPDAPTRSPVQDRSKGTVAVKRSAGGRGTGERGAGRAESARRGGSAEYKQCLAYVKREVRDRVEQARTDPEVRLGLEADLRDRGVSFKANSPEYSALVELLLLEWLDAVDYGLGDR